MNCSIHHKAVVLNQGCPLQYPKVLQADIFFNTSLKRYFHNVAKPHSKLLWVRH